MNVDIYTGVGCYVRLRPVNACGLSWVFLLPLYVPCCSGQGRVSSSGVRGREARGPMREPQRTLAPTPM